MRGERRAWLNRLLEASEQAVERLRGRDDPSNEGLLDDLRDLGVRLEAELQQLDRDD